MTKKHFELVARALARSRPAKYLPVYESSAEFHEIVAARRQWEKTVVTFGAMCTELNPKFKHKTFLDAVGWDLPGGAE